MCNGRRRRVAIEHVDQFSLIKVCHFASIKRFKFASAWKKFAFVAPTELPRILAISSCGRS